MLWNYSREAPRYCPECGNDLSEHPYCKELPPHVALFIRRVAILLLPLMTILIGYLFATSKLLPSWSSASGYYLLALIGGPSAILAVISLLFPRVPVAVCLRCNWHQDYSLE